MNRDYYQILGVDPKASAEEIKKAYRKRAFELHPDRHGGSRQAEEKFKQLTEAYAVLRDPQRRRSYDVSRTAGPGVGSQSFDPGDAFSGLFNDPAFRSLFEEMSREFARQGLRFDEPYVRRVFRHGQGPLVFGGVFFAGSLGSVLNQLLGHTKPGALGDKGSPREVGRQKSGLLRRWLQTALPKPKRSEPREDSLDIHYQLAVADEILNRGGEVRVSLPGDSGARTYRVRIPPDTPAGTKLRLPRKGRNQGARCGDLYLEVQRELPKPS